MPLRYMLGPLVVLICVSLSHGFRTNKCLMVLLSNEEFHTPCSMLGKSRIRPCLVNTQQDADVLIGARVIGGGTPIPVNHICAARQELREADCVSVHVRPDPQQTWEWTEWRNASYGIVRNLVVTEGGTDYTCPYEDRKIGFIHCLDAYNNGMHTSGVYTIRPDGITEMDVYCEMDLDGGGWAVFQRRQTGALSFFQGWAAYQAGFGDLDGEHWLGNDNIYLLTKDQNQKVMFHLRSQGGVDAFAKYSSFWIEDASQEFRLRIEGYSGDAIPGNSMRDEKDMKFSTFDNDNDVYSGNCASRWSAGWWYRACFSSNLNGVYGAAHAGPCWNGWLGARHPMPYTAIMVKPNT